MSLTEDEIAVIEKAHELLTGWHKSLFGRGFGDVSCYVQLYAWYQTHIIQAVDILIQKMPVLGGSIKAECDGLLEKAESFSAMDEEDSEFLDKKIELGLLAQRIIPRFRRLTQTVPSDEQEQEKDGQMEQTSKGGKADLPNERTAVTWYWKLYEKTIKAAFDAILDKLNPS